MTVKKNVISNYLGQIYVSLVGIAVFPLYLKYLGAEAYGLVGFYIVLQSWLMMLDIGLTPTLARQVAYARGNGEDFSILYKQLRSMEVFFITAAILTITSFYLLKGWLSLHWLQVETLAVEDVTYSIFLIGIVISSRLITSLYKSGINGLEQQVWVNLANVLFASLRFIGAIAIMHWYSTSYVLFFEYQVLISILEGFCFWYKLYCNFPGISQIKFRIYIRELKPLLPFVLSLGFTTSVWIFVSQLDKLLLSNILSLSDYGYFTIVAVISAGLMQLSAPIGNALMPRMTHLLAEKKEDEMLHLYRAASQVMAVMIFPTTAILSVYTVEVLYVWTGDWLAATWAETVLFWYVLGSGLVTIVSFQYYLQYAHGRLQLFVWINIITALIYIPTVSYVAFNYGAHGTGVVWFLLHLTGFLVVMPIVHHFFAKGIHTKWLLKDILPILVASLVGIYLTTLLQVDYRGISRLQGLGYLFLFGIFVLISALIASSVVRSFVNKAVSRLVG